jgi:hypothetical protein
VLKYLSTMQWRHMGEWTHRAPPFLTSALDGGEWSASRPCRFTPGERTCGTHWIVDAVGRRVGLDLVKERKIFHCWESNPGWASKSFLIHHSTGILPSTLQSAESEAPLHSPLYCMSTVLCVVHPQSGIQCTASLPALETPDRIVLLLVWELISASEMFVNFVRQRYCDVTANGYSITLHNRGSVLALNLWVHLSVFTNTFWQRWKKLELVPVSYDLFYYIYLFNDTFSGSAYITLNNRTGQDE